MTALTHVAPSPLGPEDARVVAGHEIALLIGGRCRACAERLRGGAALRGEACSLCHTPTALTGDDRRVLADHLQRRCNVRVGALVAAVAVTHLVVGWFPIASTVVVGLSAAWVRWQIVRPTSRLLGLGRRRVAMWTGRLGTASFVTLTLVVNEALTLVPVAGPLAKVVASGIQVALVAWLNTLYLNWQVRREQNGTPVAAWEWAALVGMGGLLLGSTVVLTAAVIAAVTAVEAFAGYLLS